MANRWVVVGIGVGAAVVGALGVGYWAGGRVPSQRVPAGLAAPLPTVSMKPTAPSTGSDGVARTLLAAAEQASAREHWLEAQRTYRQIVQEHPHTHAAVQAQQRLGEINIRLLHSPSPDPTAPFYADYTVQPGDTLGQVARRYRTTVELLQQANRLTGDRILAGRTLKVPTVTFSVVVDKSQNLLTLKANEEVIKTYVVSTGTEDQTPVGTFTIVNRLIDPPWYTPQGVIPSGSPENILGTRWLGLSKAGYGIHGTTDPATIGQPVTAGCVRMRNSDVEELYALLPPGTDVTIVD